MKSLSLALLLVLALGSSPASAQQVIKKPVFDSVQTSLRSTLYALRDSLRLVDAASARLVRDHARASDALLGSRARSIAGRCGAAGSMARLARGVVVQSGRPVPDNRGARPGLERALTELESQMLACSTQFDSLAAPGKVGELRDYGIGKGARVQQAIRRYEPSVQLFFHEAIGDRYMPNLVGAGATPSRE